MFNEMIKKTDIISKFSKDSIKNISVTTLTRLYVDKGSFYIEMTA